jgi:hypothetical protein
MLPRPLGTMVASGLANEQLRVAGERDCCRGGEGGWLRDEAGDAAEAPRR